MSEIGLQEGERVLARFRADRGTYIREHVMLAALGAVGMSALLMAIGNPYPWTGVVGSIIAIAARGLYAASEQLGFVWTLTDRRLVGPSEREYYHRWGLDAEKLAHAREDAIVMHPGPMNRGVEIDGTIADDINRSVIQEQVEMGVAVRMAAMDLLARNLGAGAEARAVHV